MAVVAVAGCMALAGCGSTSAPGAARPKVVGADTPEGAAIGFDQSVRGHSASNLKFDCLPGGEFSWAGFEVRGRPTASSTRIGSRWIVTLNYGHGVMSLPRYLVRHLDVGYCVFRVLPDLDPSPIGPSSPAPYSGSATSSPSR